MKKNAIIIAALVLTFSFLSISNAQEIIRYHGSAPIGKLIMPGAAAEFEKLENVKFDIKYRTTTYGIDRLLVGECDIAGGGRPLEENEKVKGIIETPVFIDAYAFIVHENNTITLIASEEITDIFNGKITDWDNLKGAGKGKITIISPPTDAAYYVSAKNKIGFTSLPDNAIKVEMTTDVYDTVKNQPLSIGLVSYADIIHKQRNVKILEIVHNGKRSKINQTHVYLGIYPYSQTLHFFTKGEPHANIKKFIEFFNTRKGMKVIMDAGFFLLPPR